MDDDLSRSCSNQQHQHFLLCSVAFYTLIDHRGLLVCCIRACILYTSQHFMVKYRLGTCIVPQPPAIAASTIQVQLHPPLLPASRLGQAQALNAHLPEFVLSAVQGDRNQPFFFFFLLPFAICTSLLNKLCAPSDELPSRPLYDDHHRPPLSPCCLASSPAHLFIVCVVETLLRGELRPTMRTPQTTTP